MKVDIVAMSLKQWIDASNKKYPVTMRDKGALPLVQIHKAAAGDALMHWDGQYLENDERAVDVASTRYEQRVRGSFQRCNEEMSVLSRDHAFEAHIDLR